jgi:hypothetical protein
MLLTLLVTAACGSSFAQSIYPDRKVETGRVYSYVENGVRHYASRIPKAGGYRAIAYYFVKSSRSYRINGLPCESNCSGEARGYRAARDKDIKDSKNCPIEPRAESLGCTLWTLEQSDLPGQ